MGVYIPNMEMPEHCGECRFAVDGWCYAYGKPNIDALANDGRTNFCPLVPVPPHGRWNNIIQGIIPSGQCSNCGAWDKVTRFCPNCGSQMEGE